MENGYSVKELIERDGEANLEFLTEATLHELEEGLPVHLGNCILIPPHIKENLKEGIKERVIA